MKTEAVNNKIKKNVPLAPLTTMKIGGPADFFVKVVSEEELQQAVQWSEEQKLPYFILGGGSNILVADRGFPGLVIKMDNRQCRVEGEEITAGAGVGLARVVELAQQEGLTGLEWTAGIPGSLGGAIRGNAGAFGSSIGELVKKITVFHQGTIEQWPGEKCQFAYRSTIFKEKKDLIIISARLSLQPGEQQAIARQMADCLAKRSHYPAQPSAGCVFKNPIVEDEDKEKFMARWPQAPLTEEGKVPAAWLIDTLEMKGFRIDGAKVSEEHANFIVNDRQARAEEVIILIAVIKTRVRDKFNLQLTEEIEYVGEF